MRLLNVYTYELHVFQNELERPPYVITSHRWSGDEITLQQFCHREQDPTIRELPGFQKVDRFCHFVRGWGHVPVRRAPGDATDEQPHPPEYTPLPNTAVTVDCANCMAEKSPCSHELPACERCSLWKLKCQYPPQDGEGDFLQWIWIDTCCINKDSAVELSEAINSMFRWYQESAVCLAYLHDVPSLHQSPHALLDSFPKSEWFRRGWTLQELIAPQLLVFVNRDWEVFGHKAPGTSLQSHNGKSLPQFSWYDIHTPLNSWIAAASGIPGDILAGLKDCVSMTMAEKRVWMRDRKTTRREDAAYCLLGICGVFLPLIYGEREQAMHRLEKKVRKKEEEAEKERKAANLPAVVPPNSQKPGLQTAQSHDQHQVFRLGHPGGLVFGNPQEVQDPDYLQHFFAVQDQNDQSGPDSAAVDPARPTPVNSRSRSNSPIVPSSSSEAPTQPLPEHLRRSIDSYFEKFHLQSDQQEAPRQQMRRVVTEYQPPTNQGSTRPISSTAAYFDPPEEPGLGRAQTMGRMEPLSEVVGDPDNRGRSPVDDEHYDPLTVENVERIPWRHKPSNRYPIAPAVTSSPPPNPQDIKPMDHQNDRSGDSPTRPATWSTRQPRD